jgi:hypothetical protein
MNEMTLGSVFRRTLRLFNFEVAALVFASIISLIINI